jgi:1-acyl-sn-glycerol-3-phosphate acyltransferase
MTFISKFILKLFGWKATGYEKLYSIPKFVIAIGPHTSNWDFLVGILIRSAYKLQKIKYLGKESLFKFPHGFIFRALGGYPVTRSGNRNQVDSYIHAFNANKEFAIVIAPEGTRKKVNRLKTGYYFIAKGAHVPIIPTIMNYKTRTVEFGDPFLPGPDELKDLAQLDLLFRTNVGKHPELCFQGDRILPMNT